MPITLEDLAACRLCPRACGANRLAGDRGFCGAGAGLSIASICRHSGEEPVLSEPDGICNVFFTRCNLQCTYCQNHQISRTQGPVPETVRSLDKAVTAILAQLDAGIRAVGFVSPTHMLYQMQSIMDRLEQSGRKPIYVYNSNAYDRAEVLARLAGRIGVYLPDFKYMDDELARHYSRCPDYGPVSQAALREMFRQKGEALVLDERGTATSGLIIRHLVLPGQIANTQACLRFIAEELSPHVHISLMAQYHPTPAVVSDPLLGRRVTPSEWDTVLETLDRLGLENGWVQELSSADHYRPDFTQPHPFETA